MKCKSYSDIKDSLVTIELGFASFLVHRVRQEMLQYIVRTLHYDHLIFDHIQGDLTELGLWKPDSKKNTIAMHRWRVLIRKSKIYILSTYMLLVQYLFKSDEIYVRGYLKLRLWSVIRQFFFFDVDFFLSPNGISLFLLLLNFFLLLQWFLGSATSCSPVKGFHLDLNIWFSKFFILVSSMQRAWVQSWTEHMLIFIVIFL